MEEQRNEVTAKIMGFTDEALNVVVELMGSSEDESIRLKAAQDILNRGGLKQAQEISVTHTDNTSPTQVILEKINALNKSKRHEVDEDIIDVEVEESSQDESSK